MTFINYKPKIAVLLAAFNGVKFLDQQVRSILAQSNVNVSLFISVDKSLDGTEALTSRLILEDSRVIGLTNGKEFGGAARNFFRLFSDVNFSDFDYVCLADQDDIWLPNKLFRACESLLLTGADSYSSNVTAFWSDGRSVLVEKSQPQVKWDFLFEAAGPGCTYVICKHLACAIQDVVISRWDELQAVGLHDWFIYAFARANGYKWFIDDVPSLLYRQHANNQVGVNTGWRSFRHRALKVLTGWGLEQSVLIARLIGLGEDSFVQRWSSGSRLGMLWLACNAWQCRRRLREKFLFAFSCLALFVGGTRQS